ERSHPLGRGDRRTGQCPRGAYGRGGQPAACGHAEAQGGRQGGRGAEGRRSRGVKLSTFNSALLCLFPPRPTALPCARRGRCRATRSALCCGRCRRTATFCAIPSAFGMCTCSTTPRRCNGFCSTIG